MNKSASFLYIEDHEHADSLPSIIRELNLVVIEDIPPHCLFLLRFQNNQLSLQYHPMGQKPMSISVDWTDPKNRYQKVHTRDLLPKAVGIKPNYRPSVLDTTGGLGRDAFTLATLGCQATIIERSCVLSALLMDGLRRALEDVTTHDAASRIKIIHGESIDYLNIVNSDSFDVIYLDPMFPEIGQTALPKKEMQVLQALLKNDPRNEEELFKKAIHSNAKRIVIKRARLSPFLGGLTPNLQFKGKSCRFDVFQKLTSYPL